jgi:hypothetical protein
MSSLKKIELFGMLSDGTAAKTHQADEVVRFESGDRKIKVRYVESRNKKALQLETPNDRYVLSKHYMHNYYFGDCKGIKVQVSLMKIKGELRFWC